MMFLGSNFFRLAEFRQVGAPALQRTVAGLHYQFRSKKPAISGFSLKIHAFSLLLGGDGGGDGLT
ncbi:TPA: hypothetical protein U2I10_004634 [Citrobacter amalonaticus]|nr:hypothetical protein [Citrobacter amalonaticus]